MLFCICDNFLHDLSSRNLTLTIGTLGTLGTLGTPATLWSHWFDLCDCMFYWVSLLILNYKFGLLHLFGNTGANPFHLATFGKLFYMG